MKLNKIPVIISIVLLGVASFNSSLEIGYYTFLRLVVCGTASYMAYVSYQLNKKIWPWTAGLIALLFNPFILVHLEGDTWRGIDIIVCIILFASLFILEKTLAEARKILFNEIIIFLFFIGLGIAFGFSSKLFPSEPETKTPPGYTDLRSVSYVKIADYQYLHPKYKKSSVLELAKEWARKDASYQDDYNTLKIWHEENIKNNQFDITTAVAVEEKLPEKIISFLKECFRSEKISNLGLFIVLFGYPIILGGRLLGFGIKRIRQRNKERKKATG